MRTKIIMVFCLLMVFNMLSAQTNWRLDKDNNGIKVYSADSGGTKFRAVKVDCELKGTIDKLVKILLDIPNHKDWVYSTVNSYIIENRSANDLIYYAELNFPAFTKNRDAVIHMVISRDNQQHTAEIKTDGEPAGIPEKKGLIRVPVFHARYEVSQTDADHIHIVYYSVALPGGGISAWTTNMFLTKAPYNTFLNLAGRLQRE